MPDQVAKSLGGLVFLTAFYFLLRSGCDDCGPLAVRLLLSKLFCRLFCSLAIFL